MNANAAGNVAPQHLLVATLLERRKRERQMHNAEMEAQERQRQPRIWSVHPYLQMRDEMGMFNNQIQLLKLYPEHFENYHRMSLESYTELLNLVEQRLTKQHFITTPIKPELKLSLTLRYLASGCQMKDFFYSYMVGTATISEIIRDTTEALWDVLQPIVLAPLTAEQLAIVAKNFENLWHFPNCIGCIDGKHIVIQAFRNSGSSNYNYKGSHSVVLLAICDANYRFTYVSIGAPGKESDAGIFDKWDFGQALLNQNLPLPPPKLIPGTDTCVNPVILGDAAFPLHENIMRPYPGVLLPPDEVIFNYRLSRARRMIENTFGILASVFRIFRRPIIASEATVLNIVKAAVVLHNFLRDKKMNIKKGENRYNVNQAADVIPEMYKLQPLNGGNAQPVRPDLPRKSKIVVKGVRDEFKDYFMNEGEIPWQWDHLSPNERP